jgi:lipopolysaccharide transport protein LptA
MASSTEIRTPRIDLAFTIYEKESYLTQAVATGRTVLESRPTVAPNRVTPPTRILRAEGVVAKMRDNGEEVDSVETTTPGEIDLVPNHPSQATRWMSGDRMWMKYGEGNHLESFRAVKVATRTLKPKAKEPALTWSREMTAQFDPATGDVRRMEQWDEFRYKEAAREARASRATLEAATDLITLDQAARAWDPTGSVSAARIVMNQKSGDYTAEGDVASTRLPDAKPATAQRTGSAMLEQDQPMQAKAARMTSTEDNKKILYEGNAVLWQASNRLQADRVFIDRKEQRVVAKGKVVSQFLDKKPRGGATVVRSADMVYTDADRVAHYTGGARMDREGMNVRSAEIRAWLNESDKDKKTESSLNHAFADGAVEILHTQPGRTRRGSSEHAEYYAADERVVLNGGNPQLDDSVDGITRGRQLTYRAGGGGAQKESLQVEGAETQPVVSKIRRK